MPERALPCHLLTRQWRDTSDGLELVFWAASEAGPVRVRVTDQEAVCFVDRAAELSLDEFEGRPRRVPLELQALDSGAPVDGLYFARQRDLQSGRRRLKQLGLKPFESDLKPSDRYLMERFVTASFEARGRVQPRERYLELTNPTLRRLEYWPRLSHVALDIETEGLDGALYSIALSGPAGSRVFVVCDPGRAPSGDGVEPHAGEKGALEAFFAHLRDVDPDLILGWNVVNFDLDYLESKCRSLGVPFALGRGPDRATVLQPRSATGVRVARVPGRVVLDGIELLRAGFWSFETFALDTVAQDLLGRGKRLHDTEDRVGEIRRLYREDLSALVAYNLEDCRLVEAIFERAQLVNFAIRRAQLTGLAMDRLGGSVAAFDNLYLPRLHRRGWVAGDVADTPSGPASPGGYVLDSQPGLYDDVLVLDFKSLYPSIIRTFGIDPLGLAAPGEDPVAGFLDARFAREGAILPELVAELGEVREQAKRERDAALSQAVKILMNSFYGVLGSWGCRFYDARLATSITRRGHQIIQESRDFIHGGRYRVIYGDTDSLFVLLGEGLEGGDAAAIGHEIAAELNHWWRDRLARELRLTSFLEVEFETHFLRFLMPTVRGEDTGTKKRYAGLVRTRDGGYDVVFKGLESVRTDWTPLARRFQRELYRRVFLGEPFEDYVRRTLAELMAGALDDELVYRKRLRRPVDQYTRNVPPHVQAARKQARPGRWVRYVVTPTGPEPVTDGSHRPDYAHYRDRQLAPAADGILRFLGTSFAAITDAQLSMF